MGQKKRYTPEEELELYKAMFEVLPQSMFLLDKDKTIIGVFNAAPETLAGSTVDDLVGNSILTYANDPGSPFHQACSMLDSTFGPVFRTGVSLKFQYMILDTYLEATISKISGDRILSQVRDITDIVQKQREIERKKHNEVMMAMIAGGLTSWTYHVRTRMLSSIQENTVIGSQMPFDVLLSQIEPKYKPALLNMYDDILLRGAKHSQATVPARSMNGEIRWFDLHAIPHEYDMDGNVSVIIGSQKDITSEYERGKRLRKLLKQNEIILNNTHSGFVYLLPDLTVEWENVSQIFSDPKIICLAKNGKLCEGSCEYGDRCGRCTVLQAIESKCKRTNKLQTPSGVVVEFIAQPIVGEDQLIEGIVLRVDDIGEKERAMTELAEAKEKAEQSDKLKSSFLANMSHEIRTPLNSIVGFAQLIPDAEDPEEQQGYIDIVNSSSDILLNLINDILDLSKIEAGYFSYCDTVFNLSELFMELETVFRYKMGRGVELVCTVPQNEFLVNLDRIRMTQLLTNFMTNAIKFTKQGYIQMGYEIINNNVRLFVKDTGIGMTKEESKRVFGRFEKFNMFEQGTGLGTSIAKAIVDAYKGEIGVSSVPNEGSTFWALLPINMQSNEAGAGMGSGNGSSDGTNGRDPSTLRILVAEDSDSNYMLIKVLLKGYNLTRAINGQEAVNMARENEYDIILMDIRMPIMNGIEATQKIREFNPVIPIIAVTANAFPEDRKSAFDAGVNDFLTKPVSKAALLDSMAKF